MIVITYVRTRGATIQVAMAYTSLSIFERWYTFSSEMIHKQIGMIRKDENRASSREVSLNKFFEASWIT